MHQIRHFLAVVETLNFTQAAEKCHVAQPSLSRAIIKLEEELGGELFRRERGLTHLLTARFIGRPNSAPGPLPNLSAFSVVSAPEG